MQGIHLKSDQLFPKANEQKDADRPQVEKQIAWGWQKTLYSCNVQKICLQMGKAWRESVINYPFDGIHGSLVCDLVAS